MASATSALLQLISAAVTPVVMISACAALILGINNKHTALSGQLRQIMADLRTKTLEAGRREQLLAQVRVFYLRFVFSWYALYALFAAVMVFTLTAFLIVLTQRRHFTWERGTLALFMLGMALMMAGTVCEVVELAHARRTVKIELADLPNL